MTPLSIRLFGGVSVRRGRLPPLHFPTRKSKAVFAFLVVHRNRPVSRDVLAGTLWGERPASAARKSLRNAVWRVRSALEDASMNGHALLETDSQDLTLSIARQGVWVDIADFEAGLRIVSKKEASAFTTDEASSVSDAIDSHRGDFLEGMYDDWAVGHQTQYRVGLTDMLDRMASYHEGREEWGPAIARSRELLRLDPLIEPTHRRLMRCFVARGDRPSAFRQYRQCAEILDAELGIQPMAETRALFDRIREGHDPRTAGAAWDGGTGHVRRLLDQLDDALGQIADVSARLDRMDGRSQEHPDP